MSLQNKLKLPCLFFIAMIVSCSDTTSSSESSEPVRETTITMENMGASAFVFIGIDGSGANANLQKENAEIELRVGDRFTFENMADASRHPLDFRNNDDEKLFGQSNSSGLFDDIDEIDLEMNGNAITFTLSPDLASVLNDYICSFHPGMRGNIRMNN
ncbi:hypothetical protein DYD21_03505 [Rhodohalobacter sp. SW132]|uniref:hypothetical protein n=1 Tax=Rhodohalobacter sp. SW132 TaxID=2293433 RepID=UPI000E377B0C|nr:hypothetical protein [Rhodohalobacter sp. SW132]REL39035.1 hypothetical protein DYD21_03505 [Rhodohalobacter sp. SW132]